LLDDHRFSARAGAAGGFFVALAPLGAAGALGLAAAAGLAGLAAARSRLVRGLAVDVQRTGPTGLFAALFLGWAGASLAWSPHAAWVTGLKLVVLWPLFALAAWGAASPREADRALIRRGIVAGVLGLLALLAIEATLHAPLMRAANPDETDLGPLLRNLGRGGAVLVILLAPACACLWRLGAPVWAIGSVALAGVLAGGGFGLDANAIAGVAGLVAALAALRAPGLAAGGALALFAAALLAAPLLAHGVDLAHQAVALPPSWAIRAEMWGFAADRIAERPWLGWGLEAARVFDAPVQPIAGVTTTTLQIHPHSAPLQIWMETGAVGATLAASALLSLAAAAARALRHDRPAAAACAGATAAFATLSGVSYGAWQEWLWATAAAVAACVIAARRSPREAAADRRLDAEMEML
jgi:exopolysaccharide production protein ExoQ